MLNATPVVKIPLWNAQKQVVAEAIIDQIDEERVKKIRWTLNRGGYAKGQIREEKNRAKDVLMHRYILNAPKGVCVDHLDHKKLHNTRANLRLATFAQNAQNRTKKLHSSSKYLGVTFNARAKSKKWTAKYRKVLGHYKTEEEAAYKYDSHVLKVLGQQSQINGVARPTNFQEWIPRPSQVKTLPRHISFHQSRYIVTRSVKTVIYQHRCNTLEEAKIALQRINVMIENQKSTIISRNSAGVAILKCRESGKDSNVFVDVLVDDDIYQLYNDKLCVLNKNGYPQVCFQNKTFLLHRLVMNAKAGEIIDHIDGNKVNALISNLRKVDPILNSHNRHKRLKRKHSFENAPIGVSKVPLTGKFKATITHNGQIHYCGTFLTPEAASHARDAKALELHGENANLNGLQGDTSTRVSRYKYVYDNLYNGVVKNKRQKRETFSVNLKIAKIKYYFGVYPTPQLAAIARDLKIIELGGDLKKLSGLALDGFCLWNDPEKPTNCRLKTTVLTKTLEEQFQENNSLVANIGCLQSLTEVEMDSF